MAGQALRTLVAEPRPAQPTRPAPAEAVARYGFFLFSAAHDRIFFHVTEEGEQVGLTVHDEGETSTTGRTPAGYGLVGMAERANQVGGTFPAGRDPDRGWTVDAVLPKGVTTP